MHYKKTANMVGIFATSRLVTHFFCGYNVRRFARGDCTYKHNIFALFKIKRFIESNKNILLIQGFPKWAKWPPWRL